MEHGQPLGRFEERIALTKWPLGQATESRCPCRAGIYNDLGSGSNVDVCIITKGNVEYLRNLEVLQGKTYQRANPVVYKRGTARKHDS